jgi:c(7)-type cytochrome triheme protein
MKGKVILALVLLISVALVGAAFAMPAGKSKTVETKMGSVTFTSDGHKAAGVGCMDCHKTLFKMSADSLTMGVPHKVGESCGVCHNGDKAFSVTAGCKMCHTK